MRRSAVILASILALPGCARGIQPTASMPVASLSPADAADSAATRAAVVGFVEAYAASTSDGGRALTEIAYDPDIAAWAHWLAVQNETFPGTVEAVAQIDSVGPSTPFPVSEDLPESGAFSHVVEVRASVVFTYQPDDDDPFTVRRSLDGPMWLLLDPSGRWLVADFTRDGTAFLQQFQTFDDARYSSGEVAVRLDNLASSPQQWLFGLSLANGTGGELRVDLQETKLVDVEGNDASDGSVGTSFRAVAPGATEQGFLFFPALPTHRGVVLHLVLAGGDGAIELDLPVGSLIDPLRLIPAPFDPSSPFPTPAA